MIPLQDSPRPHAKRAGFWWYRRGPLLLLALFSLPSTTGCSSAPPPVRTAAAAQAALVALVDLEVSYVRGELRGAYLAAAAGCGKTDTDCQRGAQQTALVVVGQRSTLARRAVEASKASADLIDQANRCPDRDAACERAALTTAGVHAALATDAVRQLRASRPQETP